MSLKNSQSTFLKIPNYKNVDPDPHFFLFSIRIQEEKWKIKSKTARKLEIFVSLV